jgi:hypothetical protein
MGKKGKKVGFRRKHNEQHNVRLALSRARTKHKVQSRGEWKKEAAY